MRTAPIVCPEESPLVRPQAHNFCRRGLTRRLRRGRWGCRPDGGSYFLSTRKKVPKKACGTATPGKRLLLPILTAGLAMSRAMELDSYHTGAERARARLFPPSKWAGLFPSAAYRRSAPPQLAQGIISPCGVGCFGVACVFCKAKGQREIKSTPAFSASHEARRRMAVFAVQLAGICTRPASREACRQAAVTPQPSCFPSSSPAPKGRGVGCRGTAPASRVRRRRGIGR